MKQPVTLREVSSACLTFYVHGTSARKSKCVLHISRPITASSACDNADCPAPAMSSISQQSFKISKQWHCDGPNLNQPSGWTSKRGARTQKPDREMINQAKTRSPKRSLAGNDVQSIEFSNSIDPKQTSGVGIRVKPGNNT